MCLKFTISGGLKARHDLLLAQSSNPAHSHFNERDRVLDIPNGV